MALRANALTTVANMKSQLDIPTLNTDQDAFLERLINSASQQIEVYCNRPFVVASFTEFHDANRANEIMLRKAGVTSVSSVYVDTSRVFGAETLLAATDYGVYPPNILRRHNATWGNGSQIIKVVYSAGYTVVPADVEDACILLCEQRYRQRNERQANKTSQSKVNESVSFLNEWLPQALALLEPYRVLNFISGNMATIV